MNRFLTDKAVKNHWWEWPVMVFSGVLTAIGVEVSVTDMNTTDPVVWILATAVLLGMLSAPLWGVILMRYRRKNAQSFASCLDKSVAGTMTFAELGRRTGISGAGKKLKKLVDKGYMRDISLDLTRNRAEFTPSDEVRPEVADVGNSDYNSKLQEIRRLNDEIDNRTVSDKIDRIEMLTAGIFQLIVDKPERAGEVRRFINYYLPTTFKLLESYSMLEKQKYQSGNIRASREQIEGVLDTIIKAIENQQDKLFQSDALDVETDITVLKTMMASDGLTEDGSLRAVMGSGEQR